MNAYELNVQHEATDDCWRWHCYSHQVDEVRIGTPYILCQECGHVFQSARALRKARRATMRGIYYTGLRDARTWRELWLETRGVVSLYARRAKHIHVCPHCAHDL
jgi:hypothetical protein